MQVVHVVCYVPKSRSHDTYPKSVYVYIPYVKDTYQLRSLHNVILGQVLFVGEEFDNYVSP